MAKAGGTVDRGYGPDHRARRARWLPLVLAGQAQCQALICVMPTRWIAPFAPWDLGHTLDRATWTGPEHRRCNRLEGAKRGYIAQQRGNAIRAMIRRRW